ncbi:MAG TPA: class I SAM-dependent methyltransferase [Polyangiaceae bacterium]|nr:class I SAM-dependent methyltransferase [Polyangiaceae bacterium]
MERVSPELLQRIAQTLSDEDRAEMAIPSYLHPNPALRWMAWRRLEVVVSALQRLAPTKLKGSLALDFGCGSGVLFRDTLARFDQVIGVDLVLSAAKALVAELGLKDVALHSPAEADAAVAKGSVDLLIAAEVLEHVDDLPPTLRQFQTWLKPNGRLLVSLPTENALYRLGRRLAGFSGHYHHSNAASIDEEIQRFGFRRRSLSHIPAPGPFSIYWVMEYSPPES